MKSVDNKDTITGKVVVVVSQHVQFDRDNPEDTRAHEFTFLNPEYVSNGVLNDMWLVDGYSIVGTAEVTISLLSKQETHSASLASLRNQKDKIFMKYQKDIDAVNSKIQNLIALPHIEIPEEVVTT